MQETHVFELLQAVLVIIGIGVVAYSPIPRAIGRRIMHGKTLGPGEVPPDVHRMDDLSGEVAALRHVIEEQQERIDFAERVIAQQREPRQLNVGKDD